MAASVGLILDPWQADVLDLGLAEQADGTCAAMEVGLIIPRQNGKNAALEAAELYWLFLDDAVELITHTAHRADTSLEHFRRVKALVENTPDLMRDVRAIRDTNGKEAIELHNGKRLQFKSRTKGSGRGFSGDRVVLDEAYYVVDLGALMPSLSAREDPQIWWVSSAPLDTHESDKLRGIIQRGRDGDGLAYMEWSCEPGTPLDDRQAAARANPGFGIRLSEDFIFNVERQSLTDEEFARERLGIFALGGGGKRWTVISEHDWTSSGWSSPNPDEVSGWMLDPVSFGIEVAPDYAMASIGAAGDAADGGDAIELVDHRPGTSWLVQRVVELAAHGPKHVVIDPRSPAGAFTEVLRSHGVAVTEPRTAEVVRAAGALYVGCVQGGVQHLATEDQRPLDVAVELANQRKVGDAWLWEASPSASPLRAATLALLGHRTAPEPETRSAYEDHDLTTV